MPELPVRLLRPAGLQRPSVRLRGSIRSGGAAFSHAGAHRASRELASLRANIPTLAELGDEWAIRCQMSVFSGGQAKKETS